MTHPVRREQPAAPRHRRHAAYLILIAFALLPLRARSQAPETPGPANTFESINESLTGRLETMDWGEGRVGILVEDAELPLTAFAHAESTLMKPGSLMKVLTATAALDRLGEDYRFSTRLYIMGAVEGHTLKGALVVQGEGDPTFPVYDAANPETGWAVFDRWASLLRERGIRKIDGPVIGDDRAFDRRLAGAGWPVGRLGDPNIPMISALDFNGNCVSIYWKTGRWAHKIAGYEMFPALQNYIFFSNNLRVMQDARQEHVLTRVKDGNLITASGEIEPGTQTLDRVSINDPATFFVQALKSRLVKDKIKITGPAESIADHDGEIKTEDLQLIDEQRSPLLPAVLTGMLRDDSTIDAECLFKAMGRQADAAGAGSFESGARAVNAYFDGLRLPGANRIIVDGSGLSSIDRLSPAHLVNLLRRAEGQPRTQAIAGLFPKAWEPGVLNDRFRPIAQGDPAEGSAPEAVTDGGLKAPPVQAITASAEGVEGMAGWVTNRVGRRLLFAIMIDESKAPAFQLRKQIDLLVLEIANSGASN